MDTLNPEKSTSKKFTGNAGALCPGAAPGSAVRTRTAQGLLGLVRMRRLGKPTVLGGFSGQRRSASLARQDGSLHTASGVAPARPVWKVTAAVLILTKNEQPSGLLFWVSVAWAHPECLHSRHSFPSPSGQP